MIDVHIICTPGNEALCELQVSRLQYPLVSALALPCVPTLPIPAEGASLPFGMSLRSSRRLVWLAQRV